MIGLPDIMPKYNPAMLKQVTVNLPFGIGSASWEDEMTQTKTVTAPYDVAEHLRTPEEMAAYLEASIEDADGDTAFIAKALCDIARAKGLSQVTKDLGLSHEGFKKGLSEERSLTFDTVLKVINALGLKLSIEAATPG